MGDGGTHPRYRAPEGRVYYALIGDEVALAADPATSVGVVTAIYLDGLLELSTGDDDVLAADLVLLRRADQ